MKKLLLPALAACLLLAFSCHKEAQLPATDKVMVRFENTLKFDIVDAIYNEGGVKTTALGMIPAKSKTEYFEFSAFDTASGSPVGTITGTDFTTTLAAWCGSVSHEPLKPGWYNIQIFESRDASLGRYQAEFYP